MKDCLIIGSKNTITYKEIFPLIKEGKIRLGYNEVTHFNGTDKVFHNISWFSTLPVTGRKPLVLTATYSPEKYPKYDNYDAIEVSRIKDIPYDYDGVMGVPVTILDYDLSQFGIVGMSSSAGYTKEIVGLPLLKDGDARPLIDGKNTYARILIRKVQFEIVGRSGDIEYAKGCGFFTPPSEEKSEEYKSMNKTWRVQNPYFVKGGSAETIYNRIFIKRK